MFEKSYVASPGDGCAWVTGASSGIGRALAIDLARDGWRVAVTARSADALQELAGMSGDLPGEIHAFPGNVTETGPISDLCGEISRKFGSLALVIANAGIYLPQDGLNGKAEDYRSSFDVNLMGTVNTLLPAIDAMKSQGRGQIAVVSSVAGYSGLPTSAAYGATKAGLSNLAESLKFDLDGAGIRIQIVSPGFVDTPATESNPFPMPYLLSVQEAVEQIRKGLAHPRKFEIAFPKPFVRQLKLLRILPYSWYFPFVARATGWKNKRADD
ncbi:SDR family NAD(P)-dependent oxidoreductase [Labrenzia sp. OB1]|uniref:SDR family NAD(P)-dependent oxidoreductase n=1 Tax=Labrenzia sp. OB1 TaxID=1561204 RepID=UPI0007B200A2|nr:SDR family NAD(P)-dependent oxidoreductase [Labrenzia sp. OB1]KZM49865.1 oxidoreductase [Labrenzia sp. OB1]